MSHDRQIHEQVLVAVCRILGQGIASVNTQVENGIVQVSGVVDTPDERAAVERAIWAVPDVRAITQRLRSRRTYAGGPSDRALAADVLALLDREGHTGLRVRVEDGTVTVIGQFASAAECDAMSASVATVPGVHGVWMDPTADQLPLPTRIPPCPKSSC